MSNSPILIDTSEAAKKLGVSSKTVVRMLDAGCIPSHRNNSTGQRMVEYRDLLAYKEKRDRRHALIEQACDEAARMGAYTSTTHSTEHT